MNTRHSNAVKDYNHRFMFEYTTTTQVTFTKKERTENYLGRDIQFT